MAFQHHSSPFHVLLHALPLLEFTQFVLLAQLITEYLLHFHFNLSGLFILLPALRHFLNPRRFLPCFPSLHFDASMAHMRAGSLHPVIPLCLLL